MISKTCIYLFVIFQLLISSAYAQRPEVSASGINGAVVSVDKYASIVGVEILKKGGNAIDAAIATAFTLAVTYPAAGNIGGGGFMLIHLANGENVVIDYRETAPELSTVAMFLNEKGEVDIEKSTFGYLVAGVPGTIAGMEIAWTKYGKLPWKDLLEPAINLAANGFILDSLIATRTNNEKTGFLRYPESTKIFTRKDKNLFKPGDIFLQKDLAKTLKLIAKKGAKEFYEGKIAKKIVKDFRANKGILTKNDLKNYKPIIRKASIGTYNDLEIITTPLPSGGPVVLQILSILENFDLQNLSIADQLHIKAEAMRIGFWERVQNDGDPDFSVISSKESLNKNYSKMLAKKISLERVIDNEELKSKTKIFKENLETTHFCVVDKYGNIVSNTFTIENLFGSKAVVKDLGFLLNNEMHDFNIRPNEVNQQGGYGNNPNLIEGGKRMLSSMSPIIVMKNGKPVMVSGSPGGRSIINTMVNLISAYSENKYSGREIIDLPRINHNWMPDELLVETGKFDIETLNKLKQKGQIIKDIIALGDAHTIFIDETKIKYHGEADKRLRGSAVAY